MSDWLDAEAHADRALEMYERGRWAEAEAELRQALAVNPDQAEWHFNLGLTLEASGRDADALASYERAIALLPDQIDPMLAAAILSNRLERFEQAIGWLDRVLQLDRAADAAYAHKIESLVRLGRHDEAETVFYLSQQMLAEPSAGCLAVMGESLMQRGIFERAEWCLKEALKLDPNMPRLRARLATVSAATGKLQRAAQLYLRELRDDPGNIDTLLEYGELLIDLNRLPEAAEKFRRVLELEPANIDAHFELGRIAMSGRRFEQAHIEFELVYKLDPQYPGIRAALGEALLCRGRVSEAREHLCAEHDQFKAAAQAAPNEKSGGTAVSAVPSTRTGEAPVPPSSPENVQSDAVPAIDRSQRLQLADLLLEAGEPARAAELLEEALREAEDGDALRLLALAKFRAGDRSGGAAASRRTLRLEPGCLRSIHNLALAALEQRQVRAAAGWVRRGLKINRHDEGLRRLRVRVWLASLKQAGRALFGPQMSLALRLLASRLRARWRQLGW